jgi:hypothetical protein
MATVYLSSTYGDLKQHREAVYCILRKLRHDVVAMEDYTAAAEPPLDKCLQDVAAADLYVGVLAWRYGHVPRNDNAGQLSITELEYRKASEANRPCLLFLLDEGFPWPDSLKDSVTGEGEGGRRIRALREEVARERLVSFFKTPDQLAGLVSAAVQNALASQAGRPGGGLTFRQIKAQALQKRLAILAADYQTAQDQLAATLSAVDQNKLKRQIDALEKDMEEVASQLDMAR